MSTVNKLRIPHLQKMCLLGKANMCHFHLQNMCLGDKVSIVGIQIQSTFLGDMPDMSWLQDPNAFLLHKVHRCLMNPHRQHAMLCQGDNLCISRNLPKNTDQRGMVHKTLQNWLLAQVNRFLKHKGDTSP